MKLLRIGQPGQEKPALLGPNGEYYDVSAYIDDVAGDALSDEKLNELSQLDYVDLPQLDANERIGACVGNVGKFIWKFDVFWVDQNDIR